MTSISIVIPAKNEASNLRHLLPKIRSAFPDAELVVVNDGSTDDTAACSKSLGATVVSHPYSMGNGAAIKTGARKASGEIIVFLDADGQHDPQDIPRLLAKLDEGFDMVVGARNYSGQANIGRFTANYIYNRLASWMVGQDILDLTSGFRAVRAQKFRQFLYLLPNGFSYPTTITMSFFRAGYPVAYIPIQAKKREGRSHIRLLHDGARFLLIIFRVGTLYSPLRIFVPVSSSFFLTALFYYVYTYTTIGRLTNMTVLLFTTSVLIFLIGLVSEQITNLLYSNGNKSS
ncbi:MAG: glycosyltransferase family 2 protein [Sulfurifustaceae bacterium]